MLKIILLWVLFIPIPIINGLLREKWYKKKGSELTTNFIGFLVLSSVFLLYTYLFFKNDIVTFSTQKLFSIGLFWLILTLIFEFGIGLATKKPWKVMLAEYNIMKGKFWPFILLVIFLSPFIIKSILQ